MKRCDIQCVVTFMALAVAMAMPASAQTIPLTPADSAPQAANALPITGGQLPPLALPSSPAPPPAPAANALALPLAPQNAAPTDATPAATPNLPSLPASNTAPVASVSALPSAVEPAKIYSYGDSNLSIMFLPEQVIKMKGAIRTFEDSGGAAGAPTQVVQEVVVAAPVEEKIEDPLVYPVFYLASIAYDGPGAWSLWLSGYKITSTKNDTDITVLSVSADSATFLWTPSFSKAMTRRKTDNLFASTDLVKNRLAGLQRASLDEAAGAITFTLRQNQSFAVGYFHVFEGYVDAPTLAELPAAAPSLDATAANALPPQGEGAPPNGAASPQALPNTGGAANFFVSPNQAALRETNPVVPGVPANVNPNGNSQFTNVPPSINQRAAAAVAAPPANVGAPRTQPPI